MKKVIALTALMAYSAAFAQSTTSTTNITAKKKSFTDDMSYFYWSDLRTGKLNEEVRGNVPDTYFYNMFNIRYTLNDKDRFNFQIRFGLTDEYDENGKGDRFEEDDVRVTYQRLLFANDSTAVRLTAALQLPTSRDSQADEDRIVRLKPNVIISHNFDDYNSLLVVPAYTRTIYTKGQAPTDETSRYYMSSWVMYTNKYLSDKYVLRADLETKHVHMNGKADTALETTAFDLVVGVDMNLAGTSVFPFLVHDTMGVKAVDQLGGGIQIFKVF